MAKNLETVVKIEGYSVEYLEENENWHVIREEMQPTVPGTVPVRGPGVQRSLNCDSMSTSDAAELQVTQTKGVKRGIREEKFNAEARCSVPNKKMKNKYVASSSSTSAINEVVQEPVVVENEPAEEIEKIVHLTPPKEADPSSKFNRNAYEDKGNKEEIKCSVCPNKFLTQEALRSHVVRFHEEPVQRSCKLCSAVGFISRQDLVRHVRRVHREYCYCFKCNESFGTKADFNEHLNSSTIKEFTFGLKQGLDSKTNNNEVFTVQLKFKCQICSATLNSQCEFNSHIKNHAAEESK